MASSTFFRVSGRMLPFPLMTRDTVDLLTPASFATSMIVFIKNPLPRKASI